MSGQNLVQGMEMTTGRPIAQKHKRTTLFRSGAAIPVGVPVCLSYSATDKGYVIAANTTNAARVIGFYEGVGGTGADTTTSGLTGKAAVAGDAVEVVLEGFVACRGRMTATNAGTLSTTNVGIALGCTNVDYTFDTPTAPVASQSARYALASPGAVTDGTTVEIVTIYVNI